MPGVNVRTATRSGPSTVGNAPASTFFLSGLTERGPDGEAVRLRSMADYRRIFGERPSYGFAYDALDTFFNEGGLEAYLVRVVGDAATVGTVTLQDRAATPVDTLRVDAVGVGAWSSDVTVEVEDGTVADTFKLILRYAGTTETYDNLTSPADAVTKVNARSDWVELTDLGSGSEPPTNNPGVQGPTALSAGSDDRASVVGTDYVDALDDHAPDTLGAGAVAIPGQPADTVGAGLIAHAKTNHRLALLAPAEGTSQTDVVTSTQGLRATNGEYAGIFYPWIQIPDGSGISGATRTIPPEAYVAAVRARAHDREGPWRAPGGEISAAEFAVGLERELTRSEADSLNDSEVSVLRVINGGVRLYGWRSLSIDEDNYSLLTGRDVLNYLVVESQNRLEQFVFRTIDGRGHLFSEIAAEVIGLVEPMRLAGGLYERTDDDGAVLDPGYVVDTGPTVNTTDTIANNEAHVALSVRVSPTGALIELVITKVGLTASL